MKMKQEKYLELLKENKLMELKELLESDIRDSIAIKTNSKSRLNAIKRITKKAEKIRPILGKCGKVDDYYSFTDSYEFMFLFDNLGFETDACFPNLKWLLDKDLTNLTRLYVNAEDLMYYVKTKEDYKNEFLDNMSFDYNFIKNGIDIMGKNIEIFTNKNKNMIIFKNDNNEIFGMLGKSRVFKNRTNEKRKCD